MANHANVSRLVARAMRACWLVTNPHPSEHALGEDNHVGNRTNLAERIGTDMGCARTTEVERAKKGGVPTSRHPQEAARVFSTPSSTGPESRGRSRQQQHSGTVVVLAPGGLSGSSVVPSCSS